MKVQWKKTENGAFLSLAGGIHEDSATALQALAAEIPAGPLVIDMEKVEHINSVGCGHWVRFIRSRGRDGKTELINCYEGVVTYANLLPAFIEGVSLRTVHYPLRCSSCRKPTTKLVEVAALGGDPEATHKVLGAQTCVKCGEAMELAADPGDFFDFISTQDD